MNVMDKWSQENGGMRATDRTMERARTAELAHHLSTVALRQWEKALTGIVAFPAAAALGLAASATYGVAMLERGFEIFESALGEIGRTVSQEDGGRERRPGDRSEARS
jgi:hypothetical protein